MDLMFLTFRSSGIRCAIKVSSVGWDSQTLLNMTGYNLSFRKLPSCFWSFTKLSNKCCYNDRYGYQEEFCIRSGLGIGLYPEVLVCRMCKNVSHLWCFIKFLDKWTVRTNLVKDPSWIIYHLIWCKQLVGKTLNKHVRHSPGSHGRETGLAPGNEHHELCGSLLIEQSSVRSDLTSLKKMLNRAWAEFL